MDISSEGSVRGDDQGGREMCVREGISVRDISTLQRNPRKQRTEMLKVCSSV